MMKWFEWWNVWSLNSNKIKTICRNGTLFLVLYIPHDGIIDWRGFYGTTICSHNEEFMQRI